MRAALAVLVLLACAPAAAAAPVEIRGADPESYSLDLRYSERGNGVLAGSERIEFVNRGPASLDRVWLRLWANGPDRCRPRRIRVRVDAPATAVPAANAAEAKVSDPRLQRTLHLTREPKAN